MKKKRSLFPYLAMLLVFGSVIYWILEKGRGLGHNGNAQLQLSNGTDPFSHFAETVQQNVHLGLPILLLQIVAIMVCAWCFGWLFRKIGQPAVIGEIVAGIALGPSLVGLFFPQFSIFLFPAASLGNLQFLSQLGLILFMFVIGMELDVQVIRKQAFESLFISHASIIIPYALGVALSYFLYEEFASSTTPFVSFALFMGIAMSITAFPVMARILQERNMTGTRLGTMALTSAAMGDVTGWCILALLIAIIKAGSSVSALFTIGLVIFYGLFMVYILKPLLKKFHGYAKKTVFGKSMMTLVFISLLISAFVTEAIGIHALFGAFMAGLVMPQDPSFRKMVSEKIEDLSIVLLLPIFFVITGLRTHIDFLLQGAIWAPFVWILLVAIAGKFGGTTIASRLVGQSWKDSLSIGALMNSRGLMELIVLNIGFDLGIISSQIFSMLVLMALITTFMTSPALTLIEKAFQPSKKIPSPELHS